MNFKRFFRHALMLAMILMVLISSCPISAQGDSSELGEVPFVYLLANVATSFSTSDSYWYQGYLARDTVQVVMSDLDGNYKVLLTLSAEMTSLRAISMEWSSDHSRLLVYSLGKISFFDTQGNLIGEYLGSYGRMDDVHWAGQSNDEVLFAMGRSGRLDLYAGIASYNLSTGETRVIVEDPEPETNSGSRANREPRLSPDGEWLMFNHKNNSGCFSLVAPYDGYYPDLDVVRNGVEGTGIQILAYNGGCLKQFWEDESTVLNLDVINRGMVLSETDIDIGTTSYGRVISGCRHVNVDDLGVSCSNSSGLRRYALDGSGSFDLDLEIQLHEYVQVSSVQSFSPDGTMFVVPGWIGQYPDTQPVLYLGTIDDSWYRILELPEGIPEPNAGVMYVLWR